MNLLEQWVIYFPRSSVTSLLYDLVLVTGHPPYLTRLMYLLDIFLLELASYEFPTVFKFDCHIYI